MVRERINVIHGTHQFNDPETEVVQTLVATSSLEGCGCVREEENEGGQPGVFVCVQDWSEQLYWLLNRSGCGNGREEKDEGAQLSVCVYTRDHSRGVYQPLKRSVWHTSLHELPTVLYPAAYNGRGTVREEEIKGGHPSVLVYTPNWSQEFYQLIRSMLCHCMNCLKPNTFNPGDGGGGDKGPHKGRVQHGASTDIDGDYFFFKGGSTGVIKILEPMNPLLNYYEYVIVNKGQEASIGIGVGERSYPMSRMPGWNRNSCGYHADDGKLYHERGMGSVFGPTCTDGDRMGCGVDFNTDCGSGYVNVFFTKNGKQVGNAVRMKRPNHGLYPLIGLHSRGEKVRYLGHWCRVPDGNVEPMELDHSPSSVWLRSNGVRFTEDGMTLEYDGIGGNELVQDVGIAQARHPLTRTSHYFEMEILATGKLGALAIGLAKTTYPLHRHPGWNSGAVGYHADDGKLFKAKGHGDPFGPSCTEGDVMGCGIVFSPLGTAAEDCGGSESESANESSEEERTSGSDDDLYMEESDYSDYSDDIDLLLHGLGRHHARLRARQYRRPSAVKPPSHTSNEPKCTVYFTKNGEKVGETECVVPRGGFYPVVAMLSPGERLRVDLCPLSG